MDLEIKIKTFLEGNGIALTADQLKQLNATIRETGTSAEEAGKPQITWLGSIGKAQREAAAASEGADKSLRAVSMTARETHMIMLGLERGGIGGVTTAFRGLIGIIRGPFAAAFGAAGAIAAGVAGPVLVAIKIMRDKFNENRADMEAMWTGAAERAAAYKLAIEAIEKAADKMAKAFAADLDDINDRMKEMDQHVAEADKRSAALHGAAKKRAMAEMDEAEQKELTGATPEQQAAIKQKYDRKRAEAEQAEGANDVIQKKLDADRDLVNYRAKAKEAQDSMRAMQLQLDEAKAKADSSVANAGDSFKQFGASKATLAAQNQAKEDQAAYKTLSEKLAPEMNKAAGILAETDKKLFDAATVKATIPDLAGAQLAGRGKAATKAAGEDAGQEKAMAAGIEAKKATSQQLRDQYEAMDAENQRAPGLTSPERQAAMAALKARADDSDAAAQDAETAYGQFIAANADAHRREAKQSKQAADWLKNGRDGVPPAQ